MEMAIQTLVFVWHQCHVVEVDPTIEWAYGFEAYQQGKGPGRGTARSHGWLAAHAEVVEELAARASERYDNECQRFGW